MLPEDITTLAEVLKSNGYTATAAFTGGVTMSWEFGFSQGFDSYNMRSEASFAGDTGFNEVTGWLRAHKNQPFFLFLHTFRVHDPYTDLTYAHEVMTSSEFDELNEFVHFPEATSLITSQAEKNKLEEMGLLCKEVTKTLYDGGINETDKYIGRLIEALKKLNLLDHTMIILTSDHGEEFGEHNLRVYAGHGHCLYDEVLRVPLIFYLPGFSPKPRIKQQVRLIDIMPTVLDVVGIDYDTTKMQGISLLPLIKGERIGDEELVAISEAISEGPEMKSFRTSKIKYIYTVEIAEGGERILIADNPDREELYDLEHDPGERYNLQAEEPNLASKLKNEINDILKEAVKTSAGQRDKRIEVDQETRNKLKALGYIQ
jgi:arylsulfatase A-like enzyme